MVQGGVLGRGFERTAAYVVAEKVLGIALGLGTGRTGGVSCISFGAIWGWFDGAATGGWVLRCSGGMWWGFMVGRRAGVRGREGEVLWGVGRAG